MKLIDFIEKGSDQEYLATLLVLNLTVDDDVDQDLLYTFSAVLSYCVNLKEFILQYGFIGVQQDLKYNILFNILKDAVTLNNLDMSFNCIGNLMDADIASLSSFIAASNLERINLNDNNLYQLDNNNFQTLFFAIKHCKNLQHLYLSYNELHNVNDYKFDVLCNALLDCENLVHFEMMLPYIEENRKQEILRIKQIVIARSGDEPREYGILVSSSGLNLDQEFKFPSLEKTNSPRSPSKYKFILPKCSIL